MRLSSFGPRVIEGNAALCIAPGDCLLVSGKQPGEELLITPWHGCFVHYAALRPAIRLLDIDS